MPKIKTEKAWLGSEAPHSLLLTLKGKRMPRQRQLVAVAICRRLLTEMIDPESRRAVEVAERYADGLADAEELETAYRAAQRVAARRMEACLEGCQLGAEGDSDRAWSVWRLAPAAQLACAPSGMTDAAGELQKRAARLGGKHEYEERKSQCDRIRDIFGNPFRPLPAVNSSWLSWNSRIIPKLAQTIYDERELPTGTLDGSRLAILADALEEAGCTDADILDHCRRPNEHVRGCWVIDLLLRKTEPPRPAHS